MKDLLKRCLAMLLVISMVLSTGITSAAASSGTENPGTSLDTENAITLEPSNDLELIQDSMDNMKNQLTGELADETVIFIVELEGRSLLETKPTNLSVNQYLGSSEGSNAQRKLAQAQHTIVSRILQERSGMTIRGTYQVVLNGFAVSGPASDLPYLESLPGVASVSVAQTYTYVEPVDGYTDIRQTSGVMMDSDSANAAGYTGKGTVTAILDTGIDVNHDAFQNAPADARLTLADIEKLVASGELRATATADELYYSAKIPFGFNYTTGEPDVKDTQGHGTHVSGSVGGSCDAFTGVAPDTQIVFMKVFNDNGGGATDDVIFSALEDAVLLGVDTINMSLGTPSGFTSENEITDRVYTKVMEAGINLMVSAGNETSATNNATATNLPLVTNPDNAITGSPSTYYASMGVASVNEHSEYMTYILSGDLQLVYTDANVETEMDFVAKFDGQTLEYVVVPGFGVAEDFAGLDLTGKIALVARGGGVAFTDKEANSAAAGAIGMIVYDNAEGDLIYMQGNGLIPMVFISKADGEAMVAQENKTISVSQDFKLFAPTPDGGLMSGFSSIGVAPDMTLKPEITAPGGYVYSSMPGNTYASMNGTSMASPHMAGAASVMRQYINEAFPDLSDTEAQSLINTLLMNTAVPVIDEYGVAYTPRKQGAGLAQVNAAINTGAYVTVDGCYRPKAQLGDSAGGYFSKEVTLTLHSISDTDLTYKMSAIPLTAQDETIIQDGMRYKCISPYCRVMPEEEFLVTFSKDTVTVPAGGTATVTVKLRLTQEGEDALKNFTNGTFLEGFIVLESQDTDIDLSIPYLGFYGDWGKPPVFDGNVYEGEEVSVWPSSMAMFDISTGNGFFLGTNIYAEAENYDAAKIAVSREMLAAGYRPFSMLGLLRAPKTLSYTITDANGTPLELYDEAYGYISRGTRYTVNNVIKSFYYTAGDYVNYEMGPMYYGWAPIATLDGIMYSWLDDGQYYINATATVDGTDSAAGTQTISFPITIDSEKPKLLSHKFEMVDGMPYVTVEMTDNQYIMAFQIVSPDGMSAFTPAIPLEEEEPGTTNSFTFAVDRALEAGYTSALVVIYDYALNDTTVEIPLNGDTIQPTAVNFNRMLYSVSGNQTFEVEVFVTPEDASDYTLSFSSSDESVATIRDTGKTRYDEDAYITLYTAEVTTKNITKEVTLTVSTSNGLSDSITFWVVGDYDEMPSDYVIREDGAYLLPENLNRTVRITENARNVTIVGNSANSKSNPYQGLYLNSEVSNLNLTLRDLNVTASSSTPVISFTGSGNRLIVEGESTLSGTAYGSYALVRVNSDTSLTVAGDGILNLNQPANAMGACIGGDAGSACGTLVFESATVNAASATDAAIGSGTGASGTGSITINGGNLFTTTTGASAAIGNSYAYTQGSDTVNITINGGKVIAQALTGSSTTGGAAIGSAHMGGTANISINGGEVIAITKTGGAAIGSGAAGFSAAKAASVAVSGGTVSAFSTGSGPAMGNGSSSSGTTVTIDGGAVLAVGGAGMNVTPKSSAGTALVEVALTFPSVRSLMLDGKDYRVSANHADLTPYGGQDYSDKVHLWVTPTSSTPHILVVEDENGTRQFELWSDGSLHQFHSVTYQLTGLVTDGPAKVYDPSAGSAKNVDLTGSLRLLSSTSMALPKNISITVSGETVAFRYDQTSGSFIVDKSLLTGDVLITASAVEFVDKAALNALIAQAEELDPEAYTGNSWAALLEALEAAQAESGKEPTTQASTDAAAAALRSAMENLIVRADFTELNALIAQAGKKAEVLYTSDTWAILEEALDNARAVAGDTNSTTAQVEEALQALQAALDGLTERGDKTQLRQMIDMADALFAENYSESSFSNLDSALEEAIAVYTDPDATQAEVDAAYRALLNAYNALYATTDKSQLLALIAMAEELDGNAYTSDTWAALEAALEAARAEAENENSVQSDVDAAAAALQKAIAGLAVRGDKTALRSCYKTCGYLSESAYTADSWAVLKQAMAGAKAVLDDADATQAEIDAAHDALIAALDGLVKVGEADVTRISGDNRWQTALKVADEMKANLGQETFDTIIIASGTNFADALSGSYLATVKNAPILLSWGGGGNYAYLDSDNVAYIQENLAANGTVYILGGEKSVPASYEAALSGYKVKRLGGADRFETNLLILKEAGVAQGDEILVCTSTNFADSLSASATGKPILLVYNESGKLRDSQVKYLATLNNSFCIIGGESAVCEALETAISAYGITDRLAGANRFETSVLIAKTYFQNPDTMVLAYAWNYPDGLCGGALAYSMNAPLILTMDKYEAEAASYAARKHISSGIVLGGSSLVSDASVRTIFAMDASDPIAVK